MSTVSLSKTDLENMVNQEYVSDSRYGDIESVLSASSDPGNYDRPALEGLITSVVISTISSRSVL